MKKKWRELWSRRPRLGRGGRTVRNLLLTAALALMIWGQYGCPLPTAEIEFRRLERQYLLPRSEIVYQTGFWNIGDVEEIKSRDGTYLSVFQPFVAGTIKDQVYAATLYAPGDHVMNVVPLGEGPTPIPINSVIAWVPEPGKTWMSGCNLLFYQIPGETTRTELDVDTVLLIRPLCPGRHLSGGGAVAVFHEVPGGGIFPRLVCGGILCPAAVRRGRGTSAGAGRRPAGADVKERGRSAPLSFWRCVTDGRKIQDIVPEKAGKGAGRKRQKNF